MAERFFKKTPIRIEDISNGFIIKHDIWEDTDEKTGDRIYSTETIVLEDDSRDDDLELFSKLFYKIVDIMGYYPEDRYSKNNLNIKLSLDKKGSKVD